MIILANLQDLNNWNKCVDMHGYDIHETNNYNDVMKPSETVGGLVSFPDLNPLGVFWTGNGDADQYWKCSW